MIDESEIVEELSALDSALQSYPPDAHWFCPKVDEDDSTDYTHPDDDDDDPKISAETKQERIKEAKLRHKQAYRYAVVLGLSPEVAGKALDDYRERLNRLLKSCDKCVHNYHLGRKSYLKELSEQFEDEMVVELSDRLDRIDFERVNIGLKKAHDIFSQVEPSRRGQKLLAEEDQEALLALYESLCCVNFQKNDQNLLPDFDYVFEQAQRKRPLRIGDILPAMARFLFSTNSIRRRFATTAWEKMTDELSPATFDWVVHDILTEAIAVVSNPAVDFESVVMFWEGFRLLLNKMDESLIRHSLRAMEVQPDIYRLALQHLTYNSQEIASLVVGALRSLLHKAPHDFWSAMGTISPATVAEQIFQSPGFKKVLADKDTFLESEAPPVLSWIPDFLTSIAANEKHDACRKLLDFLLISLQSNYPKDARRGCCLAGLNALHSTLSFFVAPEFKINPDTSLIVISNIMDLVYTHRGTITQCADLQPHIKIHEELKSVAALVIQNALALDCKAISSEYFSLDNGTSIQRGNRGENRRIWEAVLDIFRPGDLVLAKRILPATTMLIGLDELLPQEKKHPESLPTSHALFNEEFRQLLANVAKIFQRLSDFSAPDLIELYSSQLTARPLFASLISSDQDIHEASIEILKAATGQDSKGEAIQGLLESTLNMMLSSLTASIGRVNRAKTFGSVPYMLKINRDVLSALCGNTGILRTRQSFTILEKRAVTGYWQVQWKSLDIVFSNTETWSLRVNKPTTYMTEFIRDWMEYAEALFDEYSIFASVLEKVSSGEKGESMSTKQCIREMLEVICKNVNGLVALVRLRDEYLLSVITSLIGKLLRCLGEYGLEVDEYASNYIRDACKKDYVVGFRKTNLTRQQKAELQRALEEHQGVEVIEEKPAIFHKQGTIDAWSKSADGKQHEPKLPQKSVVVVDRNKAVLNQIRAQQQQPISDQARNAFVEKRRKEQEEKQKFKAEAAARAQALRAPTATVKGEGSGLKGIGGVAGKDHAPTKNNELLIGSSDEDSDEDDDDVDGTNTFVKKRREASKMVTEYEASRRRAMNQPQGPVKKTKIQRSAKDLRARVEPNMDKLYLEILNWDIFHPGDTPPSNNECRRIDNKYQDLDLYKRTFQPLLISEVWRSLVTAKDENNFKPVEIKVLNRLSVDKFMEVSTTMPMGTNRDLKMSERDIVLLSKSPDPMNNPSDPHCLARVDRTTRKKDVVEVTYRVSRDANQNFTQTLAPNVKVFAVKIADMTTTQREFAALSSLEYYDLCNEVLEAKPSPLQKYSDEKVSSISGKYNLNTGQAKAILSANDNDGFTLIQGPPGTGKTKTIVAMVGALMTQTLQQQQAEQSRVRPPTQGQKGPQTTSLPKKKLLICAPSNAAVDELVLRLKEGIQPLNGPRQKVNVIRIGRSDAINDSVKDVMLDELVRMKMEGTNAEKDKIMSDRDELHKKAGQIKEQLATIRPQLEEAQKKGDMTLERKLRSDFDMLKKNQAAIGARIDADKESGNTVSRTNEINRRRFQQEIIDGAHILCATLSGSGHDMFRNINVEFETVIIDEAAQCIELSALIPLKYGCSKCILVGDPDQLPPTVLSRSAQSFGYEQSLFVRMQKNHPDDVHLLDTQYRMHPEISIFPSQQFYKSRLVDGAGMAKLRDQPWHASTILGPYRFFDVKGVQTQESRGHSFINIPEINAAMKLYDRLKADYGKVHDFKGKIGIIATYKAQLNELKARFARQYGDSIFEEIEFNTTDAFQGREREIIIFSCVRAKQTGGIGFLGDIRRMNVGLTRAKSSLWVLGDSRSLQQGQFWNRLIEDSQARDRYTGGDVMGLLSKPTTRDRQSIREAQLKGPQANNNQASLPSRNAITQDAAKSSDSSEEDSDTEMKDVPSMSSSRKLSVVNGSNTNKDDNKQQVHAKRPREPSSPKMENIPPKKPKNNMVPDLDAALRAHEKQKAAQPPPGARPPPRPPGMTGVAPPRKKAAVDPFMKPRKKR